MSRGWAKASARRLKITLSCAVLCHIVSLQYLSRSSLHRLAGLPCRLLLSCGLQVVTRDAHRLSLRRLICPAQDHFIFLTVYIISMTFVLSLTQMLVLLSWYVMLSIPLYILVCATASLFCACLVSVQVSEPYVIAGSTQELYTCHFRQMARLILKISRCLAHVAQPAIILRCISLSWFFSLRLQCCPKYTWRWTLSIITLFTFIGVLSTTITFVFAMFILRPIRLLSSDSSLSICCSSCGVSVHRNMSSAKRRLEINYPSIFTDLFSQFNLLYMLSNVAVNSLGEMVSPCLTPLLIPIFSLSLCRCTVIELSVYLSFRMSMYTSPIPCYCNDVSIAWVCTESNAFS